MSVTTARQRRTTKTETLRAFSRVHQVFQVAANIVGFGVVLRVDLVLRVVNGVLVAVIVHSFCIPNSCIISHRENGNFEVLSLQLQNCHTRKRRRRCQRAAYSQYASFQRGKNFPSASKEAGA